MAVALVFAMRLRDSNIEFDEDLEEFMANVQPPITKENCSEILRRSERTASEITDSAPSNDEDEEDDDDGSENDATILATLSDGTDNDDDEEEDDELDATTRGKGRQRKKIWRNCYGESRLHLACKEKHGLRKVKQFISEGVNFPHSRGVSHFDTSLRLGRYQSSGQSRLDTLARSSEPRTRGHCSSTSRL